MPSQPVPLARRMRFGKPLWWTALAASSLVGLSIAISFPILSTWSHPGGQWLIFNEHGVLHGNNLSPPGAISGLPWYGHLQFERSPIYSPWVPWPSVEHYPSGYWDFEIPVHLLLYFLLPVVACPSVVFVLNRHRPKRGWRIMTTRGFVYGMLVGIIMSLIVGVGLSLLYPSVRVVFDVLRSPGWLLSMLMTGRSFDSFFRPVGIVGVCTVFGICIHALFRPPKPPNPGYCTNCDYNLTGNISGVCPECGMNIASV